MMTPAHGMQAFSASLRDGYSSLPHSFSPSNSSRKVRAALSMVKMRDTSMTDFAFFLTAIVTGLVTGGTIAIAKIALPVKGR